MGDVVQDDVGAGAPDRQGERQDGRPSSRRPAGRQDDAAPTRWRGDQGVSANGGTMSLRLDGVEYRLELSAEQARQLRAELRPWITRARPVGRPGGAAVPAPSRRPAPTRIDRLQLAKIRQWAQQNDLPVSPRGRVSEAVRQAFGDAHG